VKLQQAIEPGAARPVKGAFEWLELRAGKLARGVLRGRGGGNAALLPDHPTWLIGALFDCSTRIIVNWLAKVLTTQPPSG